MIKMILYQLDGHLSPYSVPLHRTKIPETVFSENILSIDRYIDFRKNNYLFYIRMGNVGCLAKGDIFFWQNILKNRSKYRGDISEQSVVCTVLISTIIIEIFRKKTYQFPI